MKGEREMKKGVGKKTKTKRDGEGGRKSAGLAILGDMKMTRI